MFIEVCIYNKASRLLSIISTLRSLSRVDLVTNIF